MTNRGLSYICVDRGTTRCPCHLMEVGQCYTCTMLRSGVCDCDSAAGWQGSCPYTEYEQRGRKSAGPEFSQEMEVVHRHVYSENLIVMTVKGGTGFAIQCQWPGAYVMADAFVGIRSETFVGARSEILTGIRSETFVGARSEILTGIRPESFACAAAGQNAETMLGAAAAGQAVETMPGAAAAGQTAETMPGAAAAGQNAETMLGKGAVRPSACGCGWRTPLSVLSTDPAAGTVDFVIRPTGPKTAWLTEPGRSSWLVTGPFYSGLLHSQGLDPGRQGRRTLAVVRGTALAPYLCARASLSGKKIAAGPPYTEEMELYLDPSGLTEDFIGDYLVGEVYHRVDLSEPEKLARIRNRIRDELRRSDSSCIMTLVSPYYMKQLTEGLTAEETERLIYPNPANLCCGEGICGACSCTDRMGQTVRLCKCSGTVIE